MRYSQNGYRVAVEDTDTGCQHGECLKCPLPECKYEHSYSVRYRGDKHRKPRSARAAMEKRYSVVVRLWALGWSQAKIADELGLRKQDVWYMVNRFRPQVSEAS